MAQTFARLLLCVGVSDFRMVVWCVFDKHTQHASLMLQHLFIVTELLRDSLFNFYRYLNASSQQVAYCVLDFTHATRFRTRTWHSCPRTTMLMAAHHIGIYLRYTGERRRLRSDPR